MFTYKERLLRGDPELVNMNDGKSVVIGPDEVMRRRLMTYGLDRCDAIIAFARNQAGRKLIALTHYSPLDTERHFDKLREILGIPGFRDAPIKRAILFEPYDGLPQDDDGYE